MEKELWELRASKQGGSWYSLQKNMPHALADAPTYSRCDIDQAFQEELEPINNTMQAIQKQLASLEEAIHAI